MNKWTVPEKGSTILRREGSVAGICIVLLIFLGGCSHKASVEGYQSIRMAKAMEAQEKELNKEKRLENLSPEKLILAGNSYLAHGNHQLAKLHFAMAVKKSPMLAPAYIGLGEALVREGQLLQARAAYEQALAINEEDKTALLALGKICRKENNNDVARQYLETAADIYPDDPEILTELAITLDSMGREVEAEPLYRKVTQLRPYQASAYNNLGFNFLLQNKYPDAVYSFYHALRLEQENKRIRNNLAVAYLLNGEEQNAVSLLKGTVGEAGAYNNVGYIYMVHGDCNKAEKAFERALDLNPHYYTRANANLEQLRRSCYLPGAVSVGHKLLDDDTESPGPLSATDVTESAIALEPTVVVTSVKEYPEAPNFPNNRRIRETKIVKVNSGHLRNNPSLGAAVLGYLKKDEKVIKLQQKNDWCFVKLADGRLGWAHKSLFYDNDEDAPITENSKEQLSESPQEPVASIEHSVTKKSSLFSYKNKSVDENQETGISASTPIPILQPSSKKSIKPATRETPSAATSSINKDNSGDIEKIESAEKSISNNFNKIDVSKLVQESFEQVSHGKFDAAIEAADKAISLDPTLINPYINRAWAYSEVGQYDKAIADCNTVLEISPNNALAFNNRGLANQRRGELHEAGMDYKKACELNLAIGCRNYNEISDIL